MGTSYILIVILLLHVYVFRKLIFRWNVFGIFFISTCIFSITGILMFPFMRQYASKSFIMFKLYLITDQDVFMTQLLAVGGLLLALYAYVFGLVLMYKRIASIDHFRVREPLKQNLSVVNFKFILICIAVFIFGYVLLERDLFIAGFFDGLIGRKPNVLLASRYGIISNYFYIIIMYNLLPFLAAVALYLMMKKKTLLSRLLFFGLFFISFLLILLLFQKRPLIIFLLALFLSGFVFRKYLIQKNKKKLTKKERKKSRLRLLIVGASLFSILLLLYYSGTTYKFNSVFEGVSKLTEVVLTRVFGRLALPAFCYVHYFPAVEGYYGVSNIGKLSTIFGFELYPDSKVVYSYFSKTDLQGSLAINSIFDFYAAFGYYGFFIGNLFMGLLLSALDAFLNRLEKNEINIIFIVFCFVFAYYLSQASLARALMGYGFFFFMLLWLFLQKAFKIKLRP